MKEPFNYSLKVWITALLLGSVILGIIMMIVYPDGEVIKAIEDTLLLSLFAFLFGAILSVPSLLLFYLVVNQLLKTSSSVFNKKVGLSLTAILLGLLPFLIGYITKQFVLHSFIYSIIYILIIVIAIWIYELKSVTKVCNWEVTAVELWVTFNVTGLLLAPVSVMLTPLIRLDS